MDYLQALKTLVGGAKNIIAASRISNNRVVVFLSNAQLVDKFIEDHGDVTINSNFIKARKLRSPSKKLIISNVSAVIPNNVLQESLTKLNLKLTSPISLLRVQPQDDEFS